MDGAKDNTGLPSRNGLIGLEALPMPEMLRKGHANSKRSGDLIHEHGLAMLDSQLEAMETRASAGVTAAGNSAVEIEP